ncbi:MAG: ArnT family glycosyltransferase [Acidimicrobiia bacterium]
MKMSRRQLTLLVVIGLTVRLVYLALFLRNYVPARDADHYLSIAAAFSDGHGVSDTYPFLFEHPTAFRPPLYPVLLGSLLVVTPGEGVLAGQLMNVVLGTFVVVLAAMVGCRIAGPRAGMVAGLAAAVYPPLLANDAVLLAESLSLVLLLAVVLLLLERRAGLAGLASGLLILTRPSAQAFALVVAVWLVWKLGWRQAAQYGLVAAAIVVPWLVRNSLLVGSPMLVTSNGFNLAAKYSPEAQDPPHYFADSAFDPRFDPLRFRRSNEAELDRALLDYAVESVREKPAVVKDVLIRNASAFFELRPWLNKGAERNDGRNVTFRTLTLPAFYVVTAAGIFGLVLYRRRAGAQLLLITAVYFTLVSIVTVAPPRVRAPIDVALCIGAGLLVGRWAAASTILDGDSAPAAADPEVAGQHVRKGRRGASLILLTAVIVPSLVVATLVARSLVQDRALDDARRALTRDDRVVADLARHYPLNSESDQPEFDPGRARERSQRLEDDLWVLYPQLPSELEDQAHSTARVLQEANTFATGLTLIILSEQEKADQEGRPWSIDEVRRRYQRRLRPRDTRFPPWEQFISGDSAREAAAMVDELRRELAS